MDKIAAWLMTVEKKAEEVYTRVAGYFCTNEKMESFFKSLAKDERWHYEIMSTAVEHFRTHSPKVQAISVDMGTREKIDGVFSSISHHLDSQTASEKLIIEHLASAEFSEWNDIFLYVVNVLKDNIAGFPRIAAMMQNHLRFIESFIETNEFGHEILEKVRKVPTVWTENILIVDDEPMICDMLKAIMMRGGGGN
jgi:hypothetical protein